MKMRMTEWLTGEFGIWQHVFRTRPAR